MTERAGKWGKGAAAGRTMREGAVFCLDRLLRLAALTASGGSSLKSCNFETGVLDVLCKRHTAATLAGFHDEFLKDSSRAEGLYLDFSQLLLRQMIKLYEKTLP